MAPEWFCGIPAAPAIDVYALGCVAYACLIGSPPFNGHNIESVMAGHLYEPPPKVSDHRADLPAGVDAILAKAIAKEPADRYPSCGAFVAALHEEIHTGAVASQTTQPPADADLNRWPRVRALVTRIMRHPKIAASVAAVLVAALIALVVVVPGPPSATATRLIGRVYALAIDPAGGVYLGTFGDSRILKVEPSGTIRTVAGTGTKGYSGDNGPATKAQLWNPEGLAVDGAGNLYIADTYNHRIRKIDSAGTITTIAGNGTQDSTGDGGPAALAELRFPVDIALDHSGNLYIAEGGGRRVRKIDRNSQISTVAGTGVEGFSGDGGPATRAQLASPLALAVDDSGNLYIADTTNYRIRKVDTTGTITSIAGNGTQGFAGDGGPAAAAELSYPDGVMVDRAGSVYIADSSNDRIRKVDAGGRISTVAGSGVRGFSGDGGPAAAAELAVPDAVAVDRDGNVYIGDMGSHRVRKVDQNGTITTFAGAGASYPMDGGPATQAFLLFPRFACVDKVGRLYIADSGNNRIRRVDPGGDITTIAGNGTAGFSGDGGPAVDAQLNDPFSLALDSVGDVYIADRPNHRVRKVTPDGKITTIAGIGGGSFSGDNGPATAADLRFPTGLAIGGDGSLYIAEGGNDQIRRVDRMGIVITAAGNGTAGFSGDGGPAREAQLNNVWGVAVDDAGNLYIADNGNNRIRKVDSSGRITTIAGVGIAGSSGDGGPATKAQLNGPTGVTVDGSGAVYVAEANGNRIREIDASGIITTVAGPPTNG